MTAGPGNSSASDARERKNSKETIHSGHFMVSDFEADDQDDEGIEVPDATRHVEKVEEIQGVRTINQGGVITYAKPTNDTSGDGTTVSIDGSLTKLFQTMSLAYRQNITSPKWNCFKGLRLRWKEKIRLNNLIWRCWHMQYIQKKNMTVCQFALDVDLQNRPEGTNFFNVTPDDIRNIAGVTLLNFKSKLDGFLKDVPDESAVPRYARKAESNYLLSQVPLARRNAKTVVLEGKYWKRHMNAVTAEYKKWRLYYKNSLSGGDFMVDQPDMSFLGLEEMDWAGSFFKQSQGTSFEEGNLFDSLDFTDMLFSQSVTSPQLFPFPNPREIARGTGNSDLLQPGLVQLQPDLADDLMIDIHEMLAGRGLPTVPEEDMFPDVEENVGLPPSSSPPSVSTPTPTTHIEYGYRLPVTHTYHQHPNHPSSPQLFSPKDSFIPSRQSPTPPQHPPQTTTNHPSSHLSPQSPRQGEALRQETQQHPRPFSRSYSASEIHLRSDGRERGASVADENHQGTPFIVPKTIPKKKYFSGGQTYIPQSPPNVPTTGAAAIIGPTTLVFPCPVSPPSSGLSPLTPPDHSREPPPPPHGAPSPRGIPMEIHDGSFSAAASDSSFFAQLLTSESCSTTSSSTQSPQSAAPPPPPHHHHHHHHHHQTNKIKVTTRVISPGYAAVVGGSPGGQTTAAPCSRSSNDASGNLVVNSNKCCSSIPVVTTSQQQQQHHHHHHHHEPPHLLPNVTLSAVTPSSIKTIHTNSAQTSNWCSSGSMKDIKCSPPYTEPTSPANSHSSASSPPTKPFRPKNDAERVQYKEHRRVCHINAEQKRRCNIKYNFEMLHSLIPSVSQNPNAKVSKAMMLQKGAEYIMQMKQERQHLGDQAEQLKNQIETLNQEISLAQSMLPATGAPMNHTRHNKIKEKFDSYIRERTLANPKYYVLALIAQPLLQTFNSSVSTASVDDLCRSCTAWLDQNCSLNVLRPVVSNAMRKLSTTTNILTTPDTLYEDIFRMVTKQESSKLSVSSVQFSPEHPTCR